MHKTEGKPNIKTKFGNAKEDRYHSQVEVVYSGTLANIIECVEDVTLLFLHARGTRVDQNYVLNSWRIDRIQLFYILLKTLFGWSSFIQATAVKEFSKHLKKQNKKKHSIYRKQALTFPQRLAHELPLQSLNQQIVNLDQ